MNKFCFRHIIQTVPAEELPACHWVSSATTDDPYHRATDMEINDRICFIVRVKDV